MSEAILDRIAVEVDRSNGKDHALDGLRMQRRVAGGKDSAFANAEQVDLADTMTLANGRNAVAQIPVDVVVECEPPVRT